MARIELGLLLFLVSAHTMLHFAAENGMVTQQTGENTHEKFVDKFKDGKAVKSADIEQESTIIDQVSLAIQSVPIIGFLFELLTTPYGLLINSNLPIILKWLISGFLGVLETVTMIKIVRGV